MGVLDAIGVHLGKLDVRFEFTYELLGDVMFLWVGDKTPRGDEVVAEFMLKGGVLHFSSIHRTWLDREFVCDPCDPVGFGEFMCEVDGFVASFQGGNGADFFVS